MDKSEIKAFLSLLKDSGFHDEVSPPRIDTPFFPMLGHRCPRCKTGTLIVDSHDIVCLSCGLRDYGFVSFETLCDEYEIQWLLRNKSWEVFTPPKQNNKLSSSDITTFLFSTFKVTRNSHRRLNRRQLIRGNFNDSAKQRRLKIQDYITSDLIEEGEMLTGGYGWRS